MTLTEITLKGGKYDGCYSACSHDTVNQNGVVYVRTEAGSNEFEPAFEWLMKLPKKQRVEELRRVKEYTSAPMRQLPSGTLIPQPLSMLIGISPLRINAYLQLIKLDKL